MEQKAKKGKMLNHSAIYALGIFIQYSTSIVMMPIYTRYLTPQDYGVADLLALGVEVVGLIIGVISAEAIFRFYFEKDDAQHKRSVAFTVFLVSLLINLVGYLFIYFTAVYSSSYLFEGTNISNGVALVRIYGATLIFQVLTAIPMAYIRAQQKPVLFVMFSVLRLVLAVACNIYFIVYQELHVVGVIYAVFTFSAIHGAILFTYMISKTGITFSGSLARKALSFSWPLMLSSFALFLVTYADRLFIKHYVDLTAVGLYSLAYKFGFIFIAVSWAPFSQMWESQRYIVAKQANAQEIFRYTFRMTQSFVLICAAGLSIFAQDILRILAGSEFQEAYRLIGIIVFAYVFNIWSQYCMFGILYSKKTIYKSYADWLTLFFTLILYFFLIPKWGAMGAAVATYISLLLRFLLLNYWSNKFFDMSLDWPRTILISVLAYLVYGISFYIEAPIMISLALNASLLFGFMVMVWFIGFSIQDRERVTDYIKAFR